MLNQYHLLVKTLEDLDSSLNMLNWMSDKNKHRMLDIEELHHSTRTSCMGDSSVITGCSGSEADYTNVDDRYDMFLDQS